MVSSIEMACDPHSCRHTGRRIAACRLTLVVDYRCKTIACDGQLVGLFDYTYGVLTPLTLSPIQLTASETYNLAVLSH